MPIVEVTEGALTAVKGKRCLAVARKRGHGWMIASQNGHTWESINPLVKGKVTSHWVRTKQEARDELSVVLTVAGEKQ